MSREEKESDSLPEYVEKWKGALQEALNIASKNAHAKAESGKLQYDKKVYSTALGSGDRVIRHNLSERTWRTRQDSVTTGSKMFILLSGDKVRVLFTLSKKKMDRDMEEFYIVTYFCSVIIVLPIQYQHPYPKVRKVGEKSSEQKESVKKESFTGSVWPRA